VLLLLCMHMLDRPGHMLLSLLSNKHTHSSHWLRLDRHRGGPLETFEISETKFHRPWTGFYSVRHGSETYDKGTTSQSSSDSLNLLGLPGPNKILDAGPRIWRSSPSLCPLLSPRSRSNRMEACVYSFPSSVSCRTSTNDKHGRLVSSRPADIMVRRMERRTAISAYVSGDMLRCLSSSSFVWLMGNGGSFDIVVTRWGGYGPWNTRQTREVEDHRPLFLVVSMPC